MTKKNPSFFIIRLCDNIRTNVTDYNLLNQKSMTIFEKVRCTIDIIIAFQKNTYKTCYLCSLFYLKINILIHMEKNNRKKWNSREEYLAARQATFDRARKVAEERSAYLEQQSQLSREEFRRQFKERYGRHETNNVETYDGKHTD